LTLLLLLRVFRSSVQVLAARAVRTVTFEGKVDAGLGSVVRGNVGSGAYLERRVGESALDGRGCTVWRKGQKPFSIQYLHI
jgi:hypothetical protein